MIKSILDRLRENENFYDFFTKLKRIYGNSIGLWYPKELFLNKIGAVSNGKRLKLLNEEESDLLIADKIKSAKPFMVARFGSTEFRNIFSDKDFNHLCLYSGFFPEDKRLLKRFREVYMKSAKFIDTLVIWNYRNHFFKELSLIKKLPNVQNLIYDEVFDIGKAWKKELANKKVLVIHPFKKSIEFQYKRMDNLKILPKLRSLQVIKAVQTIVGNKDARFKNWFDALDYMKKEIDKKDFDIAIIGCGAYGLPLAAHVKSLGKQAIHGGGAVQLLFGIMGKRWRNNNKIKTNSYWISPLAEDIPKNHKKFEGGSYW